MIVIDNAVAAIPPAGAHPGKRRKNERISGVVIDGACRDLDDCIDAGFNVYAKGHGSRHGKRKGHGRGHHV